MAMPKPDGEDLLIKRLAKYDVSPKGKEEKAKAVESPPPSWHTMKLRRTFVEKASHPQRVRTKDLAKAGRTLEAQMVKS